MEGSPAAEAVADILLRAAGLPGLREALHALREAREAVDVSVEYRVQEGYAAEARRLLEPAEEAGAARVRVAEAAEWPGGRPEPRLAVWGRLGGRFTFYGLPRGVLQPILLLYVAAAGGGWEPPRGCGGRLSAARGRLLVYVVPGLPCARALYMVLPVLLCSGGARLEAVNVESMVEQGLQPPPYVRRVPVFVSEGGVVRVGAPGGFEEAAALWEGKAI